MKWLELDRGQRRRVARAVRKGLAVADPRDAPYAIAFADASLDWLSWKRRFRPLHLMLVALVLAELTLTGGWHPALVLYPLLGFTFLRLRAPPLRKRARVSREANAELAEPLAVVATVWAEPLLGPGGEPGLRTRARPAHLASARRLGPLKLQERSTLVEEDALVALRRLDSRTRLLKNYLAWREYEVKLDVWTLGELETRNQAGVTLGRKRLESAREYSHGLARRLGAKTCASV